MNKRPITIRNPFILILETLAQSLDADFKREKLPDPSTLPEKINWQRTLPFLFLHGGCLALFCVGVSSVSLVAALLLYVIRMFAITGFYHRYFSHRTFKTSRLFQFLCAVLGNTSMQRGPLWWAATHRHHHTHSDEEEDKHSPLRKGFLWSHIGWLTSMKNFPTPYNKVHDLSRYPELVFLNRYDKTVPILYGVLMFGIGFFLEKKFPSLGVTAGQFFVWTFFISTTLLLHGTLFINSLAHLWGHRSYLTEDDSRNNFWLSLITLGEGWHNNHHRYPHAARQGFHWWEVDITYYGLKMLSWMGFIWDLRPVPASVLEESALTRIFHTNLLRKPGSQIDAALDSHFDLDSRDTYSPTSKCSPTLPHQPSRPPRHDQYEISGLSQNRAQPLS